MIPRTEPSSADLWVVRIAIALVVVFVILGAAGLNVLKRTGAWDRLLHPAQHAQRSEVSVLHGSIVQPAELHASGQLYFVPMGGQVISAQSLADYYDKKFDLHIKVLPEVELDSLACLAARKQCVAEEMVLDMKRAYPKIAGQPDSVMIVLTDEDLYSRTLGWDFTYSYHPNYQFAVVSTHRMDPAFWNDPPNEKVRLSSSRQMLTDYIAFLYFHIPRSSDPTSVMYQPLTPDGGSDDLYDSDLHSEESANGRRGEGYPCLSFSYSFDTGEIVPWPRFVHDCYENANPRSIHQETFQVELAHGQLVQRSLDFQLDSTPPIDFRRSYLSQYLEPQAFGLGGNHKYNAWLLSDGAAKLSFIDIIHEDGMRDHLQRVSSGTGFSAGVAFEDRDDPLELYGARMTWDSGHFKLTQRDGSWSTYLPCADSRCFWIGYQDGNKNGLLFDRDAHLALRRLQASDGQGIQFQADAQARIVEGTDTQGNRVSYEYDAAGCLSRIHRAHGQVELYSYDSGHHLTTISIISRLGEAPRTILINEYDSLGRVVGQTLPNGNTYKMQYLGAATGRIPHVKVSDPSGHILDLTISENGYTARMTPVRFPAVVEGTRRPN